MAVFRVERTKNYTVMSNLHLQNRRLSLKAKGLLSQMLSLPEDWDYTLAGLAAINPDGRDSIRSAVAELERAGYVVRSRKVDAQGRFAGNEYVIYESPPSPAPSSGAPPLEKPTPEVPPSENPPQSNTKKETTKSSNTDLPNTESTKSDAMRSDREREMYFTELVRENIEYDILCERPDREAVGELMALLVETLCRRAKTIRVAGGDRDAALVREHLLALRREHIEYVLDCMAENRSDIRDIRQYLLTALWNAPTTLSAYYQTRAARDLYGERKD